MKMGAPGHVDFKLVTDAARAPKGDSTRPCCQYWQTDFGVLQRWPAQQS